MPGVPIMTSYATCAFVGCYDRIEYDPKEDTERPRYCRQHMQHMRERTGDEDGLWIGVVRK